jgi:hypothetical protein
MTTPNMSLTLPLVSQTPGPTWASEINADLEIIDSHNHAGVGALVPVAGLDINADLSLATHALTDATKVVLLDQASVATLGAIYAKSGDLYWRNGGGSEVRLTNGAAIDVASVNGINGLPDGSASVTYDDPSLSYEFVDSAGANAGILAGGIICDEIVLAPHNVTLNTSAGTSAYTLNVPQTNVSAASFVTATSSGGQTQLNYLTQANSITRSMQAAVGQQIGTYAASGPFSSGSNVLNPVTLTTTGRPVVIGLQSPAGVGVPSFIRLTGDIAGRYMVSVGIAVSSSSPPVGFTAGIYAYGNIAVYINLLADPFEIPSSIIQGVYALPAGTYTFQPVVGVTSGPFGSASSVTVNGQCYAYEL